MDKINKNWVYSVNIYFNYLDIINKLFLELIKPEQKVNHPKLEKMYFDIFEYLSKIISISSNKKDKIVCIRNIDKRTGIMEAVGNNLPFLIPCIERFVKKYNFELYNIKMIRNKEEHNPHCVLIASSFKSNSDSNINLNYRSDKSNVDALVSSDLENYFCDSYSLSKILIRLNYIFDKIQKNIYDEKNNLYIQRCLNYKFNKYSNLIRKAKLHNFE